MFNFNFFKSAPAETEPTQQNSWDPNTVAMQQPSSPAAPSTNKVVSEQPVCHPLHFPVSELFLGDVDANVAILDWPGTDADAAPRWWRWRSLLWNVSVLCSDLFMVIVIVDLVQLRRYCLLRMLRDLLLGWRLVVPCRFIRLHNIPNDTSCSDWLLLNTHF